jgi:hypothetical protein
MACIVQNSAQTIMAEKKQCLALHCLCVLCLALRCSQLFLLDFAFEFRRVVMATDKPESVRGTMMASTISGMFTRIWTHPLDTIKARMQVNKMRQSVWTVAGNTLTA